MRQFNTPQENIKVTFEANTDRMLKHALEWSIDLSKPGELDRKIKELQWLMVILYGVAGYHEGKGLQADFYNMHLVTSCLFLGPNLYELSKRSQEIFLRAYLANSLTNYLMFSRPPLDITTFWKETAAAEFIVPAGFSSSTGTDAGYTGPAQLDAKVLAATEGNANPWATHVQSAIVAKDDHYAKLIRALLHLAERFGDRPAGYLVTMAPNCGWEGLEQIDGSLFLRVAGLTAEAVNDAQIFSINKPYTGLELT
ncbi:hypothetical protein CONPUDRAFT_122359 [Coniophora puteana RWD-64-598 SS2]|uniref:Uncharacterized protein n=1 Tax=Coniophora puteana (strain RWD-64-598) TaxID=741705 RepID=A0A5M3MS11_CONPW|nr:uncharacterized protein CONPUDRAFT_122359 [Coniophora puteana RWD-64-598 SS2]EIW81857.1 hypothetical protein CONPUDRAFT_122359 [Coniophora puteana RWD-64-598 SS2]